MMCMNQCDYPDDNGGPCRCAQDAIKTQTTGIKRDDVLQVFNGCLSVNGIPFVVVYPEGFLDSIDEDGRLVTRSPECRERRWDRSEIKGYWA